MFKRVERKRKRREEEEEMGLDEDTKQIMGLNDTDSDESDSGSEQEDTQSESDSDIDVGGDRDEDAEDAASEDEDVNEDPPISVGEVLRDPVYLISLGPTVHGCVVCKGKLIKNAGMATAHRNANVHRRRFERFRLLSDGVDPTSNAWELVRAIRSTSSPHRVESQEPSKRALKRQVKQATMREKRKRHKELRVKAIAKKASKKPDETRPVPPSKTNLQGATKSQSPSVNFRKKQKLESKTSMSGNRDVSAKSASRTKSSSNHKKLVVGSRTKATRKVNMPS